MFGVILYTPFLGFYNILEIFLGLPRQKARTNCQNIVGPNVLTPMILIEEGKRGNGKIPAKI